jgi:hypothetical protein
VLAAERRLVGRHEATMTAGAREKPSVLEVSSDLVVFRPWRSELIYSIGIFILACCVGAVCYLESTTILESQIALGADPLEVSTWVGVAILGALGLFAFWAIRLRKSLMAEGELRLSGSSLSLRRSSSLVAKDISELRRVTSYPGGANISLWFSEGLRLPGQWLPLGWKRTWNGWKTPDGAKVRLRRKTHPLLLALRARRADLRPGLAGIPVAVAAGLFCALLPNLGSALSTSRLGKWLAGRISTILRECSSRTGTTLRRATHIDGLGWNFVMIFTQASPLRSSCCTAVTQKPQFRLSSASIRSFCGLPLLIPKLWLGFEYQGSSISRQRRFFAGSRAI